MSDTSFKLQMALLEFNKDKPNWWNWKKIDSNGNKIPNDQRMTFANIILQDKTATLPSEAEVDAKIQELKDADTAKANAKTSGKAKLETGEALTNAEVEALFG